MRRTFLNLAALVLGLGLASPALAGHGSHGGFGSHGGYRGSSSVRQSFYRGGVSRRTTGNQVRTIRGARAYHLTHGKKFGGGYLFRGRNHRHWTFTCWSRRFGCRCYWSPSNSCWYYWNAGDDAYYPLSYAEEAPPDSMDMPEGESTSPVPFDDDALPPSPDAR